MLGAHGTDKWPFTSVCPRVRDHVGLVGECPAAGAALERSVSRMKPEMSLHVARLRE